MEEESGNDVGERRGVEVDMDTVDHPGTTCHNFGDVISDRLPQGCNVSKETLTTTPLRYLRYISRMPLLMQPSTADYSLNTVEGLLQCFPTITV